MSTPTWAPPRAAKLYCEVADLFGVSQTWTMTGLNNARRLFPDFGDRIHFICVPDYLKKDTPGTFTTQWLRDIEHFRNEFNSTVIKFWAAPRGRDFAEMSPDPADADAMKLDSPVRKQGMKLAYDLGYRTFMTHVGDPDTWFKTAYADASRYGTKAEQFKPLEAALEEYRDVTWIGAHMGGWPEDLDWLQALHGSPPQLRGGHQRVQVAGARVEQTPRTFQDLLRDQPRPRALPAPTSWPTNTWTTASALICSPAATGPCVR